MVVVGVSLATYAWFVRYRASQMVLDRFGADVCLTIRKGEKVQQLMLSPWPAESDTEAANAQMEGFIVLGDETVCINRSQDISDAPGLIHARHHLVHHRGYDWNESFSEKNPLGPLGCDFRATEKLRRGSWILNKNEPISSKKAWSWEWHLFPRR